MDTHDLTNEERRRLRQMRNDLIRQVLFGEGPYSEESRATLDTVCRVLMTYNDYGCNK